MQTKHTLETLLAYYASLDPAYPEPSPIRVKRFARALELNASNSALVALADADRTSMTDTIVLPAHRYEGLSRGRGWARKGKGTKAVWGERTDNGYRVGPGHWTVGGNDGYSRKGETTWDVKLVTVGTETWTVASEKTS